jgi:limonene-1,2-epoxide hydrolase
MKTDASEARNLERVRHWEWTWNHDVMRMVDECYAPDCEVCDMIRGRTFHGREELRAVEEQMMAIDPTRRMRITRMIPRGNVVAIEMDSVWQDGASTAKACVVLTFDDTGMIVSDHSYGGDPIGAAEHDPRTARP